MFDIVIMLKEFEAILTIFISERTCTLNYSQLPSLEFVLDLISRLPYSIKHTTLKNQYGDHLRGHELTKVNCL